MNKANKKNKSTIMFINYFSDHSIKSFIRQLITHISKSSNNLLVEPFSNKGVHLPPLRHRQALASFKPPRINLPPPVGLLSTYHLSSNNNHNKTIKKIYTQINLHKNILFKWLIFDKMRSAENIYYFIFL